MPILQVAPARHVHPLLFMRVEPCSQPSGLSRIHRPLGTRKFFHLLGYTSCVISKLARSIRADRTCDASRAPALSTMLYKCIVELCHNRTLSKGMQMSGNHR